MAADRNHILIISLIISSLLNTCLSIGEDVHLIKFKESLKNPASLDSTWIKGSNPCEKNKAWEGVQCSHSSLSALLLMNHGLSGAIDIEALKNLESLRILSLENNSFSGPIPEFNRLSSLKSLFLSGNHFSGEIPQDFFNDMASLKKLELARNNFSGLIPDSLKKLNNLMAMFLQQNQFSGPVPSFEQKSLKIIDLSYNNLHGEIPPSMARFPPTAFQGNPDVCGDIINKECKSPPTKTTAATTSTEDELKEDEVKSDSTTKWVILAIVVGVLLVTILFKAKKEDEHFSVLGKENADDVVHVHVPGSTNRRTMSRRVSGIHHYNNASDSGGGRSSKTGSNLGKSGNDLVVINEEKGVFGLSDLMKAAAEVLGGGGLGSAYKAIMANGTAVVVKRIREMNKISRDAFETEIRKLGRIRHLNILPPLAYHFRKEEKLLITEYVPKGSLLYLLHGDRGIAHAEMDWPTRLKIIKGVGRGMGFLHTEFSDYEVPHGNLKSSNILLSSNYEPLLTDYALYSLINNTQSVQALFAYKSPEAVLYQQISPKSDVYCLGIVILEIMTGKFPSQYLNNQKGGGIDLAAWVREAISEGRIAELIDPAISNASPNSLEQMEQMLRIGATCTENDAEARIDMREAIRSIEEVQV